MEMLIQYKEASCFAAGIIFAVVVAILSKFFTNTVWPLLNNNEFARWAIFSVQVGIQIFLLQQWIYGYNAMYDPYNPYNEYVFLPLVVNIPLFFVNILFGVGVIAWMAHIQEATKPR